MELVFIITYVTMFWLKKKNMKGWITNKERPEGQYTPGGGEETKAQR